MTHPVCSVVYSPSVNVVIIVVRRFAGISGVSASFVVLDDIGVFVQVMDVLRRVHARTFLYVVHVFSVENDAGEALARGDRRPGVGDPPEFPMVMAQIDFLGSFCDSPVIIGVLSRFRNV